MKSFEIVATEINYLVEQRGYLAGYTAEQLIARNIVKAIEEICELSEHVKLDPDERIGSFLYTIGRIAKQRFDDTRWQDCGPTDTELLRSEVADLFVVFCVLIKQIEAATDTRFDIAQLALDKAHNDVARGIRK